jgi:hypothetical protein
MWIALQQGLVHAVDWCPMAHSFIVIAGTMPAQATLYNVRAEPQFLFGEAHRNTISWSPHGRFVCLAGKSSAGKRTFQLCQITAEMWYLLSHQALETWQERWTSGIAISSRRWAARLPTRRSIMDGLPMAATS